MTKADYKLIAMSIWRSGFIKDKNQVRQQAKEAMRRLIVSDLIGSLRGNEGFDENEFKAACGFGLEL
jgi:hypothetical protein